MECGHTERDKRDERKDEEESFFIELRSGESYCFGLSLGSFIGNREREMLPDCSVQRLYVFDHL